MFSGTLQRIQTVHKELRNDSYPLNELLKEGAVDTFELNNDQLDELKMFIDAVCSNPSSHFEGWNFHVPLIQMLQNTGCVAHIFQPHEDGGRKPIAYWSQSLKHVENTYSASELECLRVVWALLTLRHYLQFKTFVVYTDRHSLKWLVNITEPSSRLTRWRTRLAEFYFEV